MATKISTLVSWTVAVFAVMVGGLANAQGTRTFSSTQEARSYLAENPVGPRAQEAFRFLMGQKVARQYREYPRDGRIPGRSFTRNIELSPAKITESLDELTVYY